MDFIRFDMYDYVQKNLGASYSPFWIFGYDRYIEKTHEIIKEKQCIEAMITKLIYENAKKSNVEIECATVNEYAIHGEEIKNRLKKRNQEKRITARIYQFDRAQS